MANRLRLFSSSGKRTAPGIECTKLCGVSCAAKRENTNTRQPEHLIRNRSKQRVCHLREVLMPAKRSWDANGTSLLIRLDWSSPSSSLRRVCKSVTVCQNCCAPCSVHRKKLLKIRVEGGYRGQILEWVKSRFRYCLEVVLRSDDIKGFVVLLKRWIVERTFAWLLNHQRLSKDYERFTKTSETMIQLAMIRLMLRRLKPF